MSNTPVFGDVFFPPNNIEILNFYPQFLLTVSIQKTLQQACQFSQAFFRHLKCLSSIAPIFRATCFLPQIIKLFAPKQNFVAPGKQIFAPKHNFFCPKTESQANASSQGWQACLTLDRSLLLQYSSSKLVSTVVSEAPSKHFKQYRYGMLQDSLGVKALGRSPCLKLNTVMWPFHPSTHCNRLVKQHEVKKKVVFLPVVLFIECHARKLN